MLFLTVAAAAAGGLVGLARGGRVERLASLPITWPWLALAAWLLQVVLFISPAAPSLDPWAVPLYAASMLVVGVVIVANRALPGLALLGLGLLLNAAVVVANGGFMPVADAALEAVGSGATAEALRGGERLQKSVLMRPETRLQPLGDVIPLPPLGKVYSVGDLVAAAGVFLLVAGGMGQRSRAARPPVREDA